MRSAESIVAEIELLMNRHGRRKSRLSTTPSPSSGPASMRSSIGPATRLAVSWSCMSRINTVDEDLLRYMRDNGCWYIGFGVKKAPTRKS